MALDEERDETPTKGTIMWNDKGEQVSTFKVEDDRMWLIVKRVGKYTVLHVFQTERICFVKLIETIRNDELVEANVLINKGDSFMLRSIPWKEIALRAIRQRL